MIQILSRLSFITVFFMVLVHAAPEGSNSYGLRLGGDLSDERPTCKTLNCAADKICIEMGLGAECAVPKGQPCSPNDLCEGGYYCQYRNTCSGDGSKALNADCTRNDCEMGLYCNLRVNKCLRIGS